MNENAESQKSVENGSRAAATVPRPEGSVPVVAPGRGVGPGERLAGAFASVEKFPVSVDARDRVMIAAAAGNLSELASAVQADLGITMAVIRSACRAKPGSGGVGTIPQAIQVLNPSGVLAAVAAVPSYDPLGLSEPPEKSLQRMRAHAMATEVAIREIYAELRIEDTAEATVAALLHDIGRLIVARLHADYHPERDVPNHSPEQRIKAERARYGIDHALAGGVLARRWDLPNRLAVAIERHHSESATGLAATVALADQIAHFRAGDAVSLDQLRRLSERVGLEEVDLRGILSGPFRQSAATQPVGDPCPLSERERDALVKLSEGKVYKQIAEELEVSVSTVRTHLHNIYRKLEVVDRAQAVIKAREQGWV